MTLRERLLTTCFATDERGLLVGGLAVHELAGRFGTPLYLYDGALLRQRLRDLRAHLPERVDVYFSIKANPNPEVARRFVEEGAGVEIASAAEFLRARAAGCAAERILFAGPGKLPEELDFVVSEGIGEIHVESDEEIERLAEIAARRGVELDVSVRVNPSAAASGGAMRMGGQPAAFGIDEERLDDVVADIEKRPGLRVQGVHMFAGTQILDADVLVGQWRHAFGVAGRVADRLGRPIATLDFGGGLGVPYFESDKTLDLARVRELSGELFAEFDGDARFDGTHFILEPGRFLAGPCGAYVGRAVSVKESRGTTFVVLDAGMHHHLAASGNLGQVIKRDYPVVNATRAAAEPVLDAVVVGPLCTPLDTLARKGKLAPVAVGDCVAVLQSGAYGLSASPVGFLSHPMPAEVIVEDGEAHCIRARGDWRAPLTQLPLA